MPLGAIYWGRGRKSCRFKRRWRFRSFSAPTSPLTSSSLMVKICQHQAMSLSSIVSFSSDNNTKTIPLLPCPPYLSVHYFCCLNFQQLNRVRICNINSINLLAMEFLVMGDRFISANIDSIKWVAMVTISNVTICIS